MDIVFVYMTAADQDEARKLGHLLIEQDLAACINILGTVESLYRWEGVVEKSQETAFIAKTTQDRLDELIRTVQKHHSYDTPCIAALPVQGGSPPFLEWIHQQTHKEQ